MMRATKVLGAAASVALLLVPVRASAAPTAADLGVDLPAEMAQVVTARSAGAIAADTAALDGATAAAAAAGTRRAADQVAAASAAERVRADTATLAADRATLAAATAAAAAAAAAVVADHTRVGAVAVELYTGGAPGTGPISGDLQAAQRQVTAGALLGAAVAGLEQQLHDDERTAVADAAAQVAAGRAVTDEVATLAAATSLRDGAAATLAADTGQVAAAEATVAAARQQLAGDQALRAAALAAVAQPPGAPADGSPTILGGPALDVAQIVAWYEARGSVDLTGTPIAQLVAWYLQEGTSEGVRGDVAFAQAMVETGGFSSPDAVRLNNYAGIGHCDSCAAGADFPSAQLGVRGHVQLLRSFATPGLTTAMLADPPPVAAIAPETIFVRGCCASWQSLTGVWASDPSYGHTVMSTYQSMLTSALTGP